MKYHFLGKTGIQISSLCMGTMTFGREADKVTSATMFQHCREIGINVFDCANVYSQGKAERILGDLIANCRDEVIITSKVYNQTGSDLNARGSSRRHIMAAVEASLRRLNTEYIDIYFLHKFDENTPPEEILRALNDLVSQGKILYTGASNFSAWQIMKALGISIREGWSAFKCIQPMYNLVKRQAEVEILPMAQSEQLGVMTYSPLGGGLLTGKYSASQQPASGRLTSNQMYQKRYGEEWMYTSAQQFADFAREHGFHPVSLAIAWVAHHPAVTAPIIGARNVEQLKDSLKAAEIEMTPELYAQISLFSPTPPPADDRSEEIKPGNK